MFPKVAKGTVMDLQKFKFPWNAAISRRHFPFDVGGKARH